MSIPRLVASIFSMGWLLLGASVVSGQTFPTKPIRIVTGSVGGGGDSTARQIAQGISGPLGQQIIVENRGNITGEPVAKAAPDGYTLLVDGNSLWIGALLQEMPYDAVRDFAPITVVANIPNVLVVHPSVRVKSVKDLIALAKARPGELNYAVGSIGGMGHLAAALFTSMAGANIVRIDYKGSNPALISLMGGEVQMMFPNTAAATPHVKSGRLSALAITSPQPSALAPGLPTIAASGLPGYEADSMFGMFAPAKTPAAIIIRLNQEVGRLLGQADVKERFLNGGIEAAPGTPEQLAALVKNEIAKWGKVIKDAGIRIK
jgi:tripartite-type tricarboxylate transporter receptor subunit TctC